MKSQVATLTQATVIQALVIDNSAGLSVCKSLRQTKVYGKEHKHKLRAE